MTRLRFTFALLILSSLFIAAEASAQAGKNDIAVVVHPDTPVNDMTVAEVRKVFTGDRQYWTSNMPVILLVRAPVAREREVVLKKIYQMSESQFKQFWIAKIFRSEAVSAPKIVYSSDMANQILAAVPGSIASCINSNV